MEINNSDEYTLDESSANNIFKTENELFKDEDNIKFKMISVKRRANRNGENWDLCEDGKSVLKIPGDKLTSKEREYLRTIDGVKYLIQGYKDGWRSFNKFKQGLKK